MIVFGYGSLINIDSLKKTIPGIKNIKKGKLFGFRRVFNLQAKRKLGEQGPVAVLDIEENPKSVINGVYFEVNDKELDLLKEREIIYKCMKVNIQTEDNNQVSGITFQAKSQPRTNFKFGCGVQKKYLDICLSGAKNIGAEFLDDFLESTYIGNKPLSRVSKNKL
ncbi:MAG: gamma-glutamylcyclotransferase [Patescibacteria group bacterium]|jgi:cation transport regulator ChaC|nr:gamma-glutamylcyclotransferase [Patescibacteria group bacterium]